VNPDEEAEKEVGVDFTVESEVEYPAPAVVP
jgi:hypothetical protein